MNIINEISATEHPELPPEEALKHALSRMEAAIVRMNPDQTTAEQDASWQERKSAHTRMTLLAAAVECLSKQGYAKTTTQLVAATAKISRGAMLHHYATKAELIASVIDYVFYRRMELFYGDICRLTEEQRRDVVSGVEVYWNWVQTKEFEAFLELSMASRTDPALAHVFQTKASRLDEYSFEQIPIFFPEWADVPEKTRRLAQDLIVASMQGLYTHRSVMSDRERRVAVRDLISRVVLMLREDKI